MANWTDFSEEDFLPAMRAALVWQAALGVLAALVLDGGATFRVWAVALLCHWAINWLILFRRPLNPTTVDLTIVRQAFLPLMVLIAAAGPGLLQLLGVDPTMIP